MTRAGEVQAPDDHGPGEWRCMVTGCRLFATWQTARWPGIAMSIHYRDEHQT